jgi:hypothetical protein
MGGVLDTYHARIASGVLAADPAQDAAAQRLDALAGALAQWKPRGLFGSSSPPPRGL